MKSKIRNNIYTAAQVLPNKYDDDKNNSGNQNHRGELYWQQAKTKR